ncbi:MAG: SUMF1/EgtB/PvdO family nonheme iron enzyme [Treponema sp.]|nr:SUMF1/EgtB/PvdO family nonheme iron enzyme [Treponema sp.]
MKRIPLAFLIFLVAPVIFAQHRFALVIGNSNYTTVERLANPANDAADVASSLRTLGYQVDLQVNVNNAAMGRAIGAFIQRLSGDRNNEGFFWFAGHGVQMNGENYLLPVDVDSTNDVSARYSSYPVNRLVDELNLNARNKVNIVVLDACRNNPFRNNPSGHRNLSRGLAALQDLPPDLVIIYSTAAGTVASDGASGQRNSPFAQAFIQNMERNEDLRILIGSIARETMRLTDNSQRPYQEGIIVSMEHYSLNPNRSPAPPAPAAAVQPAVVQPAVIQPAAVPEGFVRIQGGTFTMGSPANETGRYSDETQRQVTISPFLMSIHEVTQREYMDVIGENPSHFTGNFNRPVDSVSWLDAIRYCNWRSYKEGLVPAYEITLGNIDMIHAGYIDEENLVITWYQDANGYRLPTEAEWEFACRGGTTTSYNTGASINRNQANYSAEITTPAGSYAPNRYGLHDMHGNVWEWCWDIYGGYSTRAQTNPTGAASGTYRIIRGGGCNSSADYLRSAARSSGHMGGGYNTNGFRVVRPIGN